MGWRDDGWSEEVERELDAAREADRGRSGGAVTMGQVLPMRGPARGIPPQVSISPTARSVDERRCPDCGKTYDYNAPCGSPNGWRLYVSESGLGRPVCIGRRDETGKPISCWERLEEADTVRRTRAVKEERIRILEARERERGRSPRRRGGDEP